MKKILLLILIAAVAITSCKTRKYGCGMPTYKSKNFNR